MKHYTLLYKKRNLIHNIILHKNTLKAIPSLNIPMCSFHYLCCYGIIHKDMVVQTLGDEMKCIRKKSCFLFIV